jgi:hypothetical protein
MTIPIRSAIYLLNLSVYGLSRQIFVYVQIRDIGQRALSYAVSTEDSRQLTKNAAMQ